MLGLFLVLLLLAGCGGAVHAELTWRCNLIERGTYYLVECKFCSEVDTSLLIDVGAFTYYCLHYEDIREEWDIHKISMALEQSQVILENKSGQKRLLATGHADPGEKKDIYSIHCDAFDDWVISIDHGKCARMAWGIDYLSDVRVSPNDRSVRLHYIYKPSKEKLFDQFDDELYVASNWVTLPAKPLKNEGESSPVIMQVFE